MRYVIDEEASKHKLDKLPQTKIRIVFSEVQYSIRHNNLPIKSEKVWVDVLPDGRRVLANDLFGLNFPSCGIVYEGNNNTDLTYLTELDEIPVHKHWFDWMHEAGLINSDGTFKYGTDLGSRAPKDE